MVKPSFERWRAGKAYINLKLVEWGEHNMAEEVPVTKRALQDTGDCYLTRRMPSPLIVPLARACSRLLAAAWKMMAAALVASGLALAAWEAVLEPLVPLLDDAIIASLIAILLMPVLATLAMEVPFFLFMSATEAAACRDARTGKHGQRETEAQRRARAAKKQQILEKDRAVLDAFEKRKG